MPPLHPTGYLVLLIIQYPIMANHLTITACLTIEQYIVIHNTILVKTIRRFSNHRDMFLALEVNILKLITPIILNLVPINHH